MTSQILSVRTNVANVVARIFVADTTVVVGTGHHADETAVTTDLTAFACRRDQVRFGDHSLLLDGNHVYLPSDSLGRAVQFLRDHGITAERFAPCL
jgi:hypothetical protein